MARNKYDVDEILEESFDFDQFKRLMAYLTSQVMDDLLADDIGMLDLIAQADGGIQGGKQCQPAVKSHAAHILRRDAHVHDAQEKAVVIFIKKRQHRAWQIQSNKQSNLNAYIAESINGIRVTQSFVREEMNSNIFNDLSSSYRKSWMTLVRNIKVTIKNRLHRSVMVLTIPLESRSLKLFTSG